ncbi:ABC transporter permease [Microbacterium sp. M3]|uniref:ABC transporter permease n=1 Tax=Microbacterium arthrosphaerae TaxID=792652 RepID=A0ABU4H0F3_9MICO|nr:MULTISPECIES: ABC transporter permease subunit [Microbacterium]MDW4572785.1 ABC transporter permease [Microbacterium arthrosphaerae]MDW7606640.1 ABC transporter permease [Microbacterium sp. M3]
MTTVAPATRAESAARADSTHRLSFAHLLRSEWIKITTLRSTWWSLGITALLSIGISMMIASASAEFGGGYPAVSAILSPTQFTMLVAGILGAIVITGEYSTGMIRSTLTAEPRRGAVVAAKAVVVGVLIALTTVVIYAVALAATAPFVAEGIDWSDPAQSSIPLALGVVSMVVFTLIGLGFGFILRNGAGAIAVTVGVLFVLPIVFSLFGMFGESWSWVADLAEYLPMNAAAEATGPGAEELLAPVLTLAAWALVPLVGGWAVLRSRDA